MIIIFILTLTKKNENKMDPQEVREADRGTDSLWQRNAEELGLVKDGNRLYHSNSCMELRQEINLNRLLIRIEISKKKYYL